MTEHDPMTTETAEMFLRRAEVAEAEVKRLRQGLWDAAALAGVDTDGDKTPEHLAYPDIVKWALEAVRELRDDCVAAQSSARAWRRQVDDAEVLLREAESLLDGLVPTNPKENA